MQVDWTTMELEDILKSVVLTVRLNFSVIDIKKLFRVENMIGYYHE